MKVLDFFEKRVGTKCSSANVSIFKAMFPTKNFKDLGNKAFFNYLKKNSFDTIDIPEVKHFDNILATMDHLNKMVKHPSCPRNIRNQFYNQKHKILMELFKQNLVDSVIYQKPCYLLRIGEYEFHQPEDRCGFIIHSEFKITKSEDYSRQDICVPYDEELYRQWHLYYMLNEGAKNIISNLKKQKYA